MILRVENLTISFTAEQEMEVVHDLSFAMEEGEVLGLVGESGSGKSITSLTIAGLCKAHQVISQGSIIFDGVNMLTLSQKEKRSIQGAQIGMIFQEPLSALNPTMKIGKQVEEVLLLHDSYSKKERYQKVMEALLDVELPNPEELYHKYPHELSGGMRQRVAIASVIISKPKLLIADEPTTALDINTQKAIIKLLKKLNKKYGIAMIFISHNLKVVRELCPRVLIMQDGVIVEQGNTADIFANPQHNYTKRLLDAIPKSVEYENFYGK